MLKVCPTHGLWEPPPSRCPLCPRSSKAWTKGSTRAWRTLRAQVLQRDNGICHLCGKPGADSADHLIPRSKGGQDMLDNLKAAHQACNAAKQARIF